MGKPAGQSGGQYAKKKQFRLVAAQPLQEKIISVCSRHLRQVPDL
jgi:hypothetical protein